MKKAPTMFITMTQSYLGSDVDKHGVSTPPKMYHAGETHEVGDRLGKCFLDLGVGELTKKPTKHDDVPVANLVADKKAKAKAGAPENKNG